jgi:hypothetical protein
MPVTPDKVFIYGRFKNPADIPLVALPHFGQPESIGSIIATFNSTPDVAVEILREFSATELVGKVYVLGKSSGWSPVSQPGIRAYTWYQDFLRLGLVFHTEGSTPWKVLYFRQESDDSGPYVAVGLKQS